MREIIDVTQQWHDDAKPIALATVIDTWGSAPRKTGAKMAITADSQMAGSVSGGCVEGAVVEEALSVLANARPKQLQFGVADETAWEVGLACGGSIDLFVEPFDATTHATVSAWIANEQAGAIGTVLSGEKIGTKTFYSQGVWTGDATHYGTKMAMQVALAQRRSQRVHLDDGREIFVDVMLPSPQLIMVGGVHIAVALVALAQVVGFRPVVVDPRRAFGSAERFPDVALHQMWPRKAFEQIVINESTAVALLTHDPKIDDQALASVLPSDAFYIGALGSKKTAAKRRTRLLENGYTEAQMDKIYGPIGLRINARTPEEIALSIMGEIIGAWRD